MITMNRLDSESTNENGYTGLKPLEFKTWLAFHKSNPSIFQIVWANRKQADQQNASSFENKASLLRSVVNSHGHDHEELRQKNLDNRIWYFYGLSIASLDDDWISTRMLRSIEKRAGCTLVQFIEWCDDKMPAPVSTGWDAVIDRLRTVAADASRIEALRMQMLELLDQHAEVSK